MSFKTLEQRFNETVNNLYAGATAKFENGKRSNGANDDPLIVTRPGRGYWSALESRSTPVQSAARDVKRLTLFQLSSDGVKFLAKQQLLQTGNTFEFTRALNPAFIVGNAVPFLHVKRNLRPLTELVGKTDTSFANVKSMGQLQETTYNNLKSKFIPEFYIQSALGGQRTGTTEERGPIGFSRPGVGSALTKRLSAPFKALKDTVKGTISAFSPNQKRNIGEAGGDKWGPKSWTMSRPELFEYVKGIQQDILIKYQENSLNDTKQSLTARYGAGAGATTDNYSDFELIPSSEKVIKFIKYFDAGQSLSTGVPGTNFPNSYVPKRSTGYLPSVKGKISYIKDPSNKLVEGVNSSPYTYINTNFDDPINVSFAMGNDEPVKFRAFVKDLVETSTPQYTPYQYVGRIDKFVNYTGVQRDIAFKLAIIAFGPDELDVVWRRINYLTGLTFPYGFTKGLMQPNIVRLTIGQVYINQPGYVVSLSTNFNEPAGSWDIDEEVPIGATVELKFTLIEKASRIANSPFYGISENSEGYDLTLNVPAALDSLDPKKAPAVGPLTTRVETRTPPPVTNVSARDFVNASRSIRNIASTNNTFAVG